jgi:hypothetical protein
MSAVPRDVPTSEDLPAEAADSFSTFWHWFALVVLLVCWIAEATMCAERGV